jgi:lysozyme family protein
VDTAVHSGVEAAVRILQKALGVTPRDGILGPKTQAAIQHANADLLYHKFLAERIRFLGRLIESRRENAEFASGWMNRVANFVDGTA